MGVERGAFGRMKVERGAFGRMEVERGALGVWKQEGRNGGVGACEKKSIYVLLFFL